MRDRSVRSAPESALRFILPLVVAAATFLAFLPVLHAGFLSWDDDVNLVNNLHYRGLGWAQLRWMFTTMLLGHYIPLTWMSFGLNYVLGGLNPWGYHLGNLLLHAANAVLFYFIARRLLAAGFRGGVAPSVPSADRQIEPDIVLSVGAAFAALVFGVHPLRVESVAWVTERRDVLCGLFSLLALLAYLRACREGTPAQLHRGWYWTAAASFACALLSKSMAVSLPLVLLVLDFYPLRRISSADPEWRKRAVRLLLEKVPLLTLSVAISVTMLVAGWRNVLTPLATLGIAPRVAVSGYGLIFYPWKTAFPWPLSPVYELHYPVLLLAPQYLLPTALAVILTVALILARNRWPAGTVAWIAHLLVLVPVIGIVHNGTQIAADRYSYLSELGFAVLAGAALTWLLRERRGLKPLVVGACALVAVLVVAGWAAGAWRQSKVWHDSETLWRSAREADPDCTICSINLGAELVFTPSPDPARAREAEALFRHAIALRPDRELAYHGLGVALAEQRRDEEAEAAFLEYLARDPKAATGFVDLGLLRLAQHRYKEAIPWLRQALAMAPQYPGLTADLARALRERGGELQRDGRAAEADALLAEAGALQDKRPGTAIPAGHGSSAATVR